MACPLLIPFLITFDMSSEVTSDGKVAPADSRNTAQKEATTTTSTRGFIVRQISNVISFYNAAIVKFCFHSVYDIRTHSFRAVFVGGGAGGFDPPARNG